MSKLFCCKRISFSLLRKAINVVVVLCFSLFTVVGPAGSQIISGQSIGLTPVFSPPVLRGMTVHPENPLLFDFIVDRGQDKIGNDLLKDESTKLIKYFLTSMTIPDKDAWVNLSPTEKDRIIPDALGQTEMGRAMLEQDYVLKQLAASLTNPETDLGKKYWDQVNRLETLEKTTSVQRPATNNFNKVWIVPDGATVVEKDGFAYITESKLKVMLDEDRSLDGQRSVEIDTGAPSTVQKNLTPPNPLFKKEGGSVSTQVFREMILPKLVQEVNSGKNFAATRQVYQSVILAAWYKRALKDSLLGRIYADKSKIAGVETDVKDIKQKVYEQYLEAFKKGAYNVIKEEPGPDGDLIPRKYFSGGQIMASAPTVVSTPAAIRGVEGAISELGDQLALVAAGGVETPDEVISTVVPKGPFLGEDSKLVVMPSGLTLEYKNVSRIGIDQNFLVSIIEKIIDQEIPSEKLNLSEKITVERFDDDSTDKRSYLVRVGQKRYVIKRQSSSSRYLSYLKNECNILKILNADPVNSYVARLLFDNIEPENEDSGFRKYLVVNYLSGQSLSDRIMGQGALSFAESVNFAVGLAQAVAFMHERGIIHGDLTPGNIVLGPEGVKVMDFDISHHEDYNWETDEAKLQNNVITPREDFNENGLPVFGRKTDAQLDISYIGQAIYAAATGHSLERVWEIKYIKNESLREIIRRTIASRSDLSEKGRYKNVRELLKDLEVLQQTLNPEDFSASASSSVDAKLRDEALNILEGYRNQRPNDRSIIDGQQGTWDEVKVKIQSGEIIPDDDKQSLRYSDTVRKSFLPDFWYHGTGNNSNFAWDILFGKNPGYLINTQSITNRRTHLTKDKKFAESYGIHSQGFLLTFDFSGNRRLDALKYFSAAEIFSRESVGIEEPLPINLLTRNSKFDILAQFESMTEGQMETAANLLELPLQDVKNFYQNGKRDSQSAASSSIAQKLVAALVALTLSLTPSANVSAQEQEDIRSTVEKVYTPGLSENRVMILADLQMLNFSTASVEFKASVRNHLEDLFKKEGYGLIPFYKKFDPAKPAVLFIHGASGEGGAAKFVDALALYHQGANLLGYQFDVSKPLEEIAKELGTKWKDFIRENGVGQNQVIVVAHSYGNIVLRQSVLRDPNLLTEAKVVEVAPIHGGSMFALGATAIIGGITAAVAPDGDTQRRIYSQGVTAKLPFSSIDSFLVPGDPNNPPVKTETESGAISKFRDYFQEGLKDALVSYLAVDLSVNGVKITHGNAPSAPEVLEAIGKLIEAASSASSSVDDLSSLNIVYRGDGYGIYEEKGRKGVLLFIGDKFDSYDRLENVLRLLALENFGFGKVERGTIKKPFNFRMGLGQIARDIKGFLKKGYESGKKSILNYIEAEFDTTREIPSMFEVLTGLSKSGDFERPILEYSRREPILTLQNIKGAAVSIKDTLLGLNRTLPYIKFETLPGGQVISKSSLWKQSSFDETLDVLIDLAGTFQKMHEAGIIYNNVNAQSVMVGQKDGKTVAMPYDFSQSYLYGYEARNGQRAQTAMRSDIIELARMISIEIKAQVPFYEHALDGPIEELIHMTTDIYYAQKNIPKDMAEFADWLLEIKEDSARARTEYAKLEKRLFRQRGSGAASSSVGDVKVSSTPAVSNDSTVGGIDFDPSKLNLQIKRDGRGVPLPLPQQDLENINIKGLYPVILNILPVNSQTLPILGQLSEQADFAVLKG